MIQNQILKNKVNFITKILGHHKTNLKTEFTEVQILTDYKIGQTKEKIILVQKYISDFTSMIVEKINVERCKILLLYLFKCNLEFSFFNLNS